MSPGPHLAHHDDVSPRPHETAGADVPDVPLLQVRSSRIAQEVWALQIIGSLDLATAPLLDAEVALALRSVPPHVPVEVEVDLRALTFLCSAGLDALHAVAAGLATVGAQITLVGAQRQRRTLLQFADEHCWLTGTLIRVLAHSA